MGTRASDLLPKVWKDLPVLAARIDSLVVDLETPILGNCRLEPVTYLTPDGNDVYRRPLPFPLAVAARKAFPAARLVIGHSLAGGYYYDLEGDAPGGAPRLGEALSDLVARDLPIERITWGVGEAIAHFEERGRMDKVRLLRRAKHPPLEVFRLEDVAEIPFGPIAATTGAAGVFSLIPYPPGFVLRFPHKRDPSRIGPPTEQTRLFQVYHESKQWSRILGIENVGDLNEVVAGAKVRDLIQVAEALHERRIGHLADEIAALKKVRLVLIAGPSSSGKTTFSKRLAVHLRVTGRLPHPLSLDHYFIDREKTPKDEDGAYDFEALEALDLALLNEHLPRILAGEEVRVPHYDFKTGRQIREAEAIALGENGILVVEGIHGLNEALTRSVPAEQKRKIYVSALTQLTIDDLNRIPTTETRLLRRLTRDRKYRGYPALDTIRRWPSVTRGEARNIFPV